MAKRFTDTDKWKYSFLRELPANYKLLWLYINDDCNHAGIWEVDIAVARMKTGEDDLTKGGAIEIFGDAIVVFDNGKKWFIPEFIEFQYGELNIENRAHSSVIKLLNKFNLLQNKPLTSPLQGAMDKDKDKDNITIKDSAAIFLKIKHLQITYGEYNKLLEIGYAVSQVETVFNSIANYSKIKNYTSLYLTCLNWLKKEFPDVLNPPENIKIIPIFSIDEQLPTRQVKPAF